MSFKFPFLFTVQHQVRYLLEWTDEDLDEEEDAVSAADLEFCHPLCQCPKCAPAQKVWFASIARGGGSKADSSFSPWESCFSASYFPSGRWWVFPDTWWGLGSSGWREATLVKDLACAARLLSDGRLVRWDSHTCLVFWLLSEPTSHSQEFTNRRVQASLSAWLQSPALGFHRHCLCSQGYALCGRESPRCDPVSPNG